MVKLSNLSKEYDGKKVLESFSVDLPDKGLIAICGPSGCGKTTLLRIIAGLEKVDQGEIIFSVKHSTISISFQEPRLLAERTAAENVNFVIGDKKATLPKAKELLKMLDILESDLYPDELSGGMKARVAIARALAKNPKLLLCDEPTGALDYQTGKAILQLLQNSGRNSGMTVIIITHNSALTDMADRVIRVRSGTVVSVECNSNPKDISEIEW